MPTTFRPYEPDRMLLLAPSSRDWLPEGHLADHVSDLAEGLDPTAFHAPHEGDGRRRSPYEPRTMAKVPIHGCATRVLSSRGMARRLEEDVAFRVLAAGNFPGRRTIRGFRRRRLADFKRLFAEVVRLAAETGVADFGKPSIDGAKARANASRRKATSHGRMLEEERGVDGHVALGREGRRDIAADAEKHPAKARMAAKPTTAAGRAQCAQRKWPSEAPNGWIEEALGFRRFGLRGLDQVRGERDLACPALNIRRLQGLRTA